MRCEGDERQRAMCPIVDLLGGRERFGNLVWCEARCERGERLRARQGSR
jgi:hypothetical protein